MLRKEQNDLLTQTGPGTPMGKMFRCYWLPALLAEELPENECPPVRVKLLSERLLAFRDSDGPLRPDRRILRAPRRVAVVRPQRGDPACAAPITAGNTTSPASASRCRRSRRKAASASKIKLKSYPLVERGGVLWTYMGPPEKQPPLPEWEFATVPADQRFVSKRLQECNWLQAMEGGIDSSHVSFLHRGELNRDPLFKGSKGNQYNLTRREAVVRGGREPGRAADRRAPQRRERQILLAHHAVGDAVVHHDPAARRSSGARAFLDPDRRRELLGLELRLSRHQAADDGAVAGDEGRQGHPREIRARHVPAARQQGQRLPDRPRRPEGRQDLSAASKASPCRTPRCRKAWGRSSTAAKENLVSTDNGIIMARHRLLRAAKALVEKGITPPGVDPAHQRVRSAAVVLPPDQPFKDAAKDALVVRPNVAHASV